MEGLPWMKTESPIFAGAACFVNAPPAVGQTRLAPQRDRRLSHPIAESAKGRSVVGRQWRGERQRAFGDGWHEG
jgi:hypothetical protein